MFENAYQIGPKLVFRGFILGSIFVCLVGFYLTGDIAMPTRAEEFPPPNLVVEGSDENLNDSEQNLTSLPEAALDNRECQISEQFPPKVRQWCELIMSAAEKHHLPPDLIASVIWIESGGDPLAYSHSGAVGLMQVMPRDGLASEFQCVNGPCFENRPTIEQLQDPQFNINYGSKLLAGLIKRHGNFRDALKAYGPMKVGYSYADKVLSIYKQYGR